MLASSRNRLAIVTGAIAAIALPSVLLYAALFRQAPAQDFLVFYSASRLFLLGHLSSVMNDQTLTAEMNRQFAAWLTHPYILHPWLYPPTFLLLMVPLGLFPPAVAYALFLCSTFACLVAALNCHIPRSSLRHLCALILLASPAAAFTIAVGQNSFLTTALLVGGFGLMQRNPVIAGAMLGVLTVKPQLCLLIPVALVASRNWRGLFSAAGSASLLLVASVATFGTGFWHDWVSLLVEPNQSFQDFVRFGQSNDQSVYIDACLLGASTGMASLIQALTTSGCAILVWWSFRQSRLRRDLLLVVLLTSTVIAAPHVANYDTVMVAAAGCIFLCFSMEQGLRFGNCALIVALWIVELFNPPREFRVGLVTPLVYLIFLATVIIQGSPKLRRAALPKHPATSDANG